MDKADGKLSPLFRQADANLYQAKQNGRNRAELG
jgi:PleD family two-component response regulator